MVYFLLFFPVFAKLQPRQLTSQIPLVTHPPRPRRGFASLHRFLSDLFTPSPSSISFTSYSLRTLLHLPKDQPLCFQAIPHSLRKTTGGGGRAQFQLHHSSSLLNTQSSPFSSFTFIHFRTLPSSVSCNPRVCHSYENCRVCTNNSHSGTHYGRGMLLTRVQQSYLRARFRQADLRLVDLRR